MNIKPIKKQVYVEQVEQKKETESGIILSGGLGEMVPGKVLAVADDVTEVKVGDQVFLDWNKSKIVVKGKTAMVLEENIFGVIEE